MEGATAVQLEMEKQFSVSADRLYEAWTTEKDLKQWWHPMENELQRVTNELKEGGTVRYEFATKEGGEAFTIDGTYKEVKERERLVYTWNWHLPSDSVQDSEFLLTIEFSGDENSSRLHVRQDQFSSEEAVHPHREGWEKALQSLQGYLQASS